MKSNHPSFARYVVAVVLCLIGWLSPAPSAEPLDRQAVMTLVEELSAARFRTRQKAAEELWKLGPAVEPFLAEALKSADAETTERILEITHRFSIGITPDTPQRIRQLIAEAIDGQSELRRKQATLKLAKEGEFKPVLAVLKRIPSDSIRRNYVTQIISGIGPLKPSADWSDLDDFFSDLLTMAISENNPRESAALLSVILYSGGLRSRLSSPAWIERIIKLAAACPGHVERRRLIDPTYFSGSDITGMIHQKGLLVKWINLVASDPDRSVRRKHIAKLMRASRLNSTSYSQIKVDKLYDDLTPEGRNALIDLVSTSPPALKSLHEQIGDDKILAGCQQTTEAEIRGNLIGHVVALESWPSDANEQRTLLDFLEQESDESAQHELVIGFLQCICNPSNTTAAQIPQDIKDAVWELIATGDPQAWQLRALLQTYGSEKAFGDYHDAASLQRMLATVTKADHLDVRALANAPVNNQYLCDQIKTHDLPLSFLQTVADAPKSSSNSSSVSSLLRAVRFTDAFDDAEKRQSLLQFCKSDLDAQIKRYVIVGLLSNASLLTKLLDEAGYETVKEALLARLPGDSARDDILGRLVSGEAVVKHFIKVGKVDELLKLKGLKKESLVTRLRPIVSSDAAVDAIMNKDQLDTLIDAIERVEDKNSQADLKRRLMARPGFVKGLAKQNLVVISLKDFQTDQNWMRHRGYEQFIDHLELADVAGEPDLAKTFWNLVPQLESDYAKRQCITKLLMSRWFLPQLSAQGDLDFVRDTLGDVLKQDQLRSVIHAWVRHENAMYFMHAERIAWFLEVCEVLSENDQRTAYRYFAQSSPMRTWFESPRQPDAFIKVLDAIKDDDRRAKFAESVLASGILSQQKDNQTLAAKLIAFTKRQPKPLAARLALVLFSQYQINDAVMKSNLPQMVIEHLQRSDTKIDVIKQVLQSSQFAAMLVKQNKARTLVDKVLAMTDPQQRFDFLHLIAQNYYLQAILSDDELRDWFDEYLKRSESQTLSPHCFQYPAIVNRLIEQGYVKAMRAIVDAQIKQPATSYSSVPMAFYTQPAVVKQMRADNQSAEVLYEIVDRSASHYQLSHMSRLMSSRDALQWALETRGWERLEKHLDQLRPTDRTRLWSRLLQNNTVMEYLIEHDALEALLKKPEMRDELARTQIHLQVMRAPNSPAILGSQAFRDFLSDSIDEASDPANRQSMFAALSNSQCYPTLLKQGHEDWLFATLEKLSAADRADPESRHFKSATDTMVKLAIETGRLDQAQQLLSRFLVTDESKLRLVRFLLLRGTLDDYLNQLAAEPLPPTTEEQTGRQRLKFFLLRAAGRLDKAEQIAKELGDALSWSLAIERHQWEVARKIPVCEEHELPSSRTNQNINPIHRKVEQLGFSIALDQLTGREDEARQSLDELSQWVDQHVGDLNNVRYGADALLMNGKPDASLELLDAHLPRRAFYWHWDRLDFDQALSQLDWSADQADTCFDRYSSGENGTQAKRMIGVNYLLDIAKLLRLIGRNADIDAALDALIRHPQVQELDAKVRRSYLGQLCKRLYEEGFRERSRMVAAELIDEKSMAMTTYFAYIYAGRADSLGYPEASAWWREFEARYPDDSTVRRLARVDGAMTATTPIDQLRPLPSRSVDGQEIVSVPITCLRYGLIDEVRQILDANQPLKIWDHAVASGRIYLAEKNYQAAAQAFHRAWELRRTDLTRLYMAGRCWERAGDVERGQQFKNMALMLPVSASHLHGLSIGLASVEHAADAADVARVVMRTAAPGSRPYIDSLAKVYEQTDEPDEKLQLWREHCLYHLRPIQYYLRVQGWVRSITRHHVLAALAAIDNGDMAAAKLAWQDATQISAGYMWIADWIVPPLRQRGQHELAEEIFRTHERYLLGKIEEYPESGELQKRLSKLREICAANPN